MDEQLFDASSERFIISTIFRYGKDGINEVSDIISKDSFNDPFYRACYSAMEDLISETPEIKIDVIVLEQKIKDKKLMINFSVEDLKLIRAISIMPVELSNARKMAIKMAKLYIARKVRDALQLAAEKINDVKGDESIGQILGIAEEAILDNSFTVKESDDRKITKIGDGLESYLDDLNNNPVEQIGFPIGLPQFEKSIGGGIRPGTVHVFGARPGVGKTFLSNHFAYNAAKNGVNVLSLDTEMYKSDHWNRLVAKLSGLKINDIERGNFDREKARKAEAELNSLPYSYQTIGGLDFEEVLAIMRRWLIREVGLDSNGKAKSPSLVVFDYIKLMDDGAITKNIAEYQAIGFLMNSLHNFMNRYGVACVAFVQLNRDGVEKEDSTTASQSDRIFWLCSTFNIYKWKDREDLIVEMNKSEEVRRTHKIINLKSRHGKGLSSGDFIHIITNYSIGKIEEGPLNSEVEDGDQDGQDEESEPDENGEFTF